MASNEEAGISTYLFSALEKRLSVKKRKLMHLAVTVINAASNGGEADRLKRMRSEAGY